MNGGDDEQTVKIHNEKIYIFKWMRWHRWINIRLDEDKQTVYELREIFGISPVSLDPDPISATEMTIAAMS